MSDVHREEAEQASPEVDYGVLPRVEETTKMIW